MGERRRKTPIISGTRPRPLDVVVLDGLEIDPDHGELLRYMGYPAGVTPPERVARQIDLAVEASREHLRPRATYSLYEVIRQDKRSLTLGNQATFKGAIGQYLRGARYAAVFLATAGKEIVQFAEDTFRSGNSLGGFILGAIGSRIAEGAVEAIVEHLRGCVLPGDALTLRYSPGFCGMNLDQQRLIFELVETSAVGVELLPSLLMKPIKSVSGILGVGPAEEIEAYGSACDRCPLLDCNMRR